MAQPTAQAMEKRISRQYRNGAKVLPRGACCQACRAEIHLGFLSDQNNSSECEWHIGLACDCQQCKAADLLMVRETPTKETSAG